MTLEWQISLVIMSLVVLSAIFYRFKIVSRYLQPALFAAIFAILAYVTLCTETVLTKDTTNLTLGQLQGHWWWLGLFGKIATGLLSVFIIIENIRKIINPITSSECGTYCSKPPKYIFPLTKETRSDINVIFKTRCCTVGYPA